MGMVNIVPRKKVLNSQKGRQQHKAINISAALVKPKT